MGSPPFSQTRETPALAFENSRFPSSRVFGSVVVVAFQIAFRAEIHANDVFLFFKNHF
jgi:hypothetical protein